MVSRTFFRSFLVTISSTLAFAATARDYSDGDVHYGYGPHRDQPPLSYGYYGIYNPGGHSGAHGSRYRFGGRTSIHDRNSYFGDPSLHDHRHFNQPSYRLYPHHHNYSLPPPLDGHLEDDAIDEANPLTQQERVFGNSPPQQ